MDSCVTITDYKDKTFDQVLGLKKLPIQNFRIKLNSENGNLYKPGDVIEGKVLLNNYEDLGCLGIAVSLEGYATVSYQSGSIIRKRVEKLLSPETNKWTTKFLVGCADDYNNYNFRNRAKHKHYRIFPGENVFSFKISTVKLNPFAGTFMGTSGEVSYRIIACLIIKASYQRRSAQKHRDFKFVERAITFQSYLNLETIPQTINPVTIENGNSFFSKKKLRSTVYFSRTGFLPGEVIPFTLTVYNEQGKNISLLKASLICKTTYSSDVTSRINSAILGLRENNDINSINLDGNIEWIDFVTIPSDLYPSVSGQLIQCQYSVKVEIYEAGKQSPTLKYCVPITIGTVREDESLSINNRPLVRSMSVMSLTSNTGSFASLPPSYSDIFASTMSIETLPPLYEDVAPGCSEVE